MDDTTSSHDSQLRQEAIDGPDMIDAPSAPSAGSTLKSHRKIESLKGPSTEKDDIVATSSNGDSHPVAEGEKGGDNKGDHQQLHWKDSTIKLKFRKSSAFVAETGTVSPPLPTKPQPLPLSKMLFQLMDPSDRIIFVLAVICALVGGCGYPIYAIIYSKAASRLATSSTNDIENEMFEIATWLFIEAVVTGLAVFGAVLCFRILAGRMRSKLKEEYLFALLRQEVSWHETHDSTELRGRFTSHVPVIADAFCLPLWGVVTYSTKVIASVIVAFIADWQLTLVTLSLFPVAILASKLVGVIGASNTTRRAKSTVRSSTIAREDMGLLRTIWAYGLQLRELTRYSTAVNVAYKSDVQSAYLGSLLVSLPSLILILIVVLAFGYGGQLIRDGTIGTGEHVILVFFAGFYAAQGITSLIPWINKLREAQFLAADIFSAIDRKSKIDPLSRTGINLKDTEEEDLVELEFKGVYFAYPTRPEKSVLRNFNLKLTGSSMNVIIGPSGAGKSTLISMLTRLYDPQIGSILWNKSPIKEFNVAKLRNHVAVVDQVSSVFPGSIYDNITMGKPGASLAEADAHEFISEFSDGYFTNVGHDGDKLSGGQKLRICLSRALISNPRVLLLDEPTAALDMRSEIIIMDSLREHCEAKGITCLLVTHRMHTIIDADLVILINDGQVTETGLHKDLIQTNGHYKKLVIEADANFVEKGRSRRSSTVLLDTSTLIVESEHPYARASDPNVEEAALKMMSRSSIRGWIWAKSRKFRSLFIASTILSFLEATIWPLFAVCVTEATVVVLHRNHSAGTVAAWCIGFSGLFIGNVTVVRSIRTSIFAFVLRQPAAWFDRQPKIHESIANTLNHDVPLLPLVLADSTTSNILTFFTLLYGVIISLYSCYIIGFIVLLSLPIGFASFFVMYGNYTRTTEADTAKEQSVIDLLKNTRSIAALRMEKYMINRMRKVLSTISKTSRNSIFGRAALVGTTMFGYLVVLAGAYWYSGVLIYKGTFSAQEILRAINCITISAAFAGVYASQAAPLEPAQRAASAAIKLLPDELELTGVPSPSRKMPKLLGKIEFRNVFFSYPSKSGAVVLDDVSFVIPAGASVAFVGRSGAGKSTIFALLERFYVPSSGNILIDDIPIADIDIDHLRGAIALVAQEPPLFDMSIMDNIAYGSVSDDAVHDAALKSNASAFAMEFHQGYETIVGSGGNKLNGGQKQRVAIARAMIRSASTSIVLLDEPTSALDYKSEVLAQNGLEKLGRNKTVINVAHRLQTIESCNLIFVLEKGKLVEQGSHQNLLREKGVYFKMINSDWADDVQ